MSERWRWRRGIDVECWGLRKNGWGVVEMPLVDMREGLLEMANGSLE